MIVYTSIFLFIVRFKFSATSGVDFLFITLLGDYVGKVKTLLFSVVVNGHFYFTGTEYSITNEHDYEDMMLFCVST